MDGTTGPVKDLFSCLSYLIRYYTYEHGREVCRARGRAIPRFFEANVKSLILIIDAPPDLYFKY